MSVLSGRTSHARSIVFPHVPLILLQLELTLPSVGNLELTVAT